jgi:hypothetical protein
MVDYIRNGSLAQRELLGELSLGYIALGVPSSYLSNFMLAQFAHSIFGARRTSTFLDHVLRVVFGGSGKEMFRVDAPFNIARVANSQPVGDLSKVDLIRKAMGAVMFGVSANLKRAIAGVQDCANPEPARFCLFNSGPEFFNQRGLPTWYCNTSHEMSLLNRFRKWLGSHAVNTSVLSRLILAQEN